MRGWTAVFPRQRYTNLATAPTLIRAGVAVEVGYWVEGSLEFQVDIDGNQLSDWTSPAVFWLKFGSWQESGSAQPSSR